MLRAAITVFFLILAGCVVALSFRVGADTPWGGLWLNLGTEIVGIALTVSIVEWLFERRESRRGQRHEIVSSLARQMNLAVNSLDRIYQFNLNEWTNQYSDLRDRLPRRKTSLAKQEHIAVEEALSQSEKSLKVAHEIASFKSDASGWRDLMEQALDQRDEELEVMRLAFERAKNANVDVAELRMEFKRVAPILSHETVDKLTKVLGAESPNFEEAVAAISSEGRIYFHELKWLSRFERDAGRVWRGRAFDGTAEGLGKIEEKAKGELASRQIPSAIATFAETYMVHERAALAKRAQYTVEVSKLNELVTRVQSDILEETPLD